MSNIDEQPFPPRIEAVNNSAISFSGNATTYNVQGNQYNTQILAPRPWTPPVMQPPLAACFIGREDDLDWLPIHLKQEKPLTLTICGSGGMGKTALVAEAVARLIAQQEWTDRYPDGIVYYSFYPNSSLPMFFEHLTRIYEEDLGMDPHLSAVRALSRRQALLIFDGVEVIDDTRPLQTLGGRNTIVLLSRRQSDALDPTRSRWLGVLSKEQSLTLLQSLAKERASDLVSARCLIHIIGGYPLALQLIGNYLQANQQEVREYLLWYEQEGLSALHHGERSDQSIPKLLLHTYDTLSSDIQSLFLLLGLFAPTPFPSDFVELIVDYPFYKVQQGLGTLVNLGILRREDHSYIVNHALIHTFAHECLISQKFVKPPLSPTIVQDWLRKFISALSTKIFLNSPYDISTFILWYPHVQTLLATTVPLTSIELECAFLFNNAGYGAFIQARYAESEPLLTQALAIREQMLGEAHPDVATSLNNLAALYQAQGKYLEAEQLFESALTIYKQKGGKAHADIATSLSNLAMLYTYQGRYAEAEPLLTRALAMREQILGEAHPDVAVSLNNLALLYEKQGRYKEIETLYQKALEIYEQRLGATHFYTATSLNNLAEFYRMQGRYSEAEPLYKRTLAIYEDLLDDCHPDIAMVLNNVAILYMSQGRYVEVEPLLLRAIAIREQRLGMAHPHTAASLNNLAELYQAQGRYSEAEALYKRALTICENHLGENHPLTTISLNNLAGLYGILGYYQEAEALYQRALAIRKTLVGENHPDMAISLNNLASFHHSQGRYLEAEVLYKRALTICENHLGENHLHTAGSLNNLALLYQEQEQYTASESLYLRALAIRKQTLVSNHPDIAQSFNNLAGCYEKQKRYKDAERFYQQALAIQEQTLGVKHPHTATSFNNLALLYKLQGRYTDAEPLYKQAAITFTEQFGMDHPQTRQVIHNYLLALSEIHTGGDVEALLRLLNQNTPDNNESIVIIEKPPF